MLKKLCADLAMTWVKGRNDGMQKGGGRPRNDVEQKGWKSSQ